MDSTLPPPEPTENAAPPVSPAPAVAPESAAPAAAAVATMTPAECGQQLKLLFPGLFAGAPKPLKLRIQADIQQRAPGRFSKPVLSAFFRRYTGSTAYLIALSRATQRFDLDGLAAGELSEEHRQLAAEELARRRALNDTRRAGEDAQRAELEQQRQNRARLLHDFERTTLTRANFCALAGLPVEELDAVLARAREEAAAAPPPREPRFERRPDPRPERRPEGRPARRPEGREPGGPRR
jgi:sRNA-binding protein